VGSDITEQELRHDLEDRLERFRDDVFSRDLYRALANNIWRKPSGPDGGVALSWSRAEALVNDLRAHAGRGPLELEQTGREGEVSDLVRQELDGLDWHQESLDTSGHDARHAGKERSSPPSQDHEPPEWEQRAHAEADEP